MSIDSNTQEMLSCMGVAQLQFSRQVAELMVNNPNHNIKIREDALEKIKLINSLIQMQSIMEQ